MILAGWKIRGGVFWIIFKMIDVERLGRKSVGLVISFDFWFYFLLVASFTYALTAFRSAEKSEYGCILTS